MNEGSQKPENKGRVNPKKTSRGINTPNASQKNIAPALFVSHHPGRAFLNESPRLAWGSLSAFLHPGSIHAEIVVIICTAWCQHEIYGSRDENARYEQAEDGSAANENESNAYFFESTRQAHEFVVLFVHNRYAEQEQR
jgi:hypothetical protein